MGSDMARHRDLLSELEDGELSEDGSVECNDTLTSSRCCCCGVEQEAIQDIGSSDWQHEVNYCTRLKVHLARALIMNPEVLVLQRPLYHYNEEEGLAVFRLLRDHVQFRGLGLPVGSTEKRRPRTLFFTADTVEHIMGADVAWTVQRGGVETEDVAKQGPSQGRRDLYAQRFSQTCIGLGADEPLLEELEEDG